MRGAANNGASPEGRKRFCHSFANSIDSNDAVIYQSEVQEIQSNLADVVANELYFDRTVLLIAGHECRKFRGYKIGNVVIHLLVTCRLN